MFNVIYRLAVATCVVIFICSCTEPKASENDGNAATSAQTTISLNVYKSASCGCCDKWIEHIHEQGLQTNVYNSQELSALKSKYGIGANYRSCHTAVSANGYIIEGHVPAKFIHKFLAENHVNVIGLSVPAMPLGSPGMEVGDKFMPYQVLLLKTDGSHVVFQQVNSYEEQF